MDIRKLQRAIVDGLEDVKAQDIAVFNTEAMSPLFERVIIASGTSNRQTKALAASVRDTVKQRGMQVLRTEGEDNGEWIIVDCGAAVAHIMQPAIREYYHLEEIWGDKPVRMKVAAVAKGLPKASEPPAAQTVPARHAASKAKAKAKAGEAARGKATASRPAAQAPARKKPAAKTPAAQAPRARRAGADARPGAAKKVVAKTPAARKPAAPRATTAARASTSRTGAKAVRGPAAKTGGRKGPPRG
jgi:ribosome-associated protein